MRRLREVGPFVCLAGLGLGVAYAAASGGGDTPRDSSIALLLVGCGGLLGGVLLRSPSRSPEKSLVDRLIDITALLLPAYVILQLVPLPLIAVRILSPARAALADRLGVLVPMPMFLPLTISAPSTAEFLVRVAGCATIFFTVRRFAAVSARRRWWAVVPLLVISLFEAISAIVQPADARSATAGTFDSRNHFANMLGMVLPFSLGFAAVAISARRGEPLSALRALAAAAALTSGGTLAVGIVMSFSKGGVVAALISVVVMGTVGVSIRLSPRRRRIVLPLVPVAALILIVWIAPPELIGRFAAAAGSDDPSEGRSAITHDALRLAAAYPLVGVGLGNFYPGILPYQTVAPDVAWVNAHDDYVQLLTELGLVGLLIVGGFATALLWRSARMVLRADSVDSLWFATACIGAMVMFLVHSSSEFNSYVLANALAMSWVAGLAASLPAKDHTTRFVDQRYSRLVPVFAVAITVFTTVWAAGWLIFLSSYHSNPRVEAAFCGFGICDTAAAVGAQRRSIDAHKPVTLPVEAAVTYLRRDSASPRRWADVGRALFSVGRTNDAVYAYTQVERLGPRTPMFLLNQADFQFDAGRPEAALALIARALRETDDADVYRGAFIQLADRRVDIVDVFEHALPDRRSAQAYFRRLLTRGDLHASRSAWDQMMVRGYIDNQLAGNFVNLLIEKGNAEEAARDWSHFVAAGLHQSPSTVRLTSSRETSEQVFNGSFEADPTGCRFDWLVDSSQQRERGVTVGFDSEVRHSGVRSLRIRFDGQKNVDEVGAVQWLFLTPGRYRLNAYVRTDGVSTDQGIRLRLAEGKSPSTINVATDDARGTHDWVFLEREFDAPPDGGLVRLWLARTPSLKFDSLVNGTAWVDDVSVAKVG